MDDEEYFENGWLLGKVAISPVSADMPDDEVLRLLDGEWERLKEDLRAALPEWRERAARAS